MDLLLAIVAPVVDTLHAVAQQNSTTFSISDKGIKYIGAGMAMGLGAFGPALGIGNMVGRALDALGRHPEAQPAIPTNMILGLAFAAANRLYPPVTARM